MEGRSSDREGRCCKAARCPALAEGSRISVGPAASRCKWTAPKGAKPAHYVVLRDGKSLGKTTRDVVHRHEGQARGGRTATRSGRYDARKKAGALSPSVRVTVPAAARSCRRPRRRRTRCRRSRTSATSSPTRWPTRSTVRRSRPGPTPGPSPTPSPSPQPDARRRRPSPTASPTPRRPTPSPTATPSPSPTPVADVRRPSPTSDARRRRPTPVADAQRPSPTPDARLRRPTPDARRPSPTPDARRRRPTPVAEPTPVADARRPTPVAHADADPDEVVMTAAMVDRLFWRAGFGPAAADRATVGRQEAVGELVDWFLNTPASRLDADVADCRVHGAPAGAQGLGGADRPARVGHRARARVDRPHAARGQPAARTGWRSSGIATGRSAATTASSRTRGSSTTATSCSSTPTSARYPNATFHQLAYDMTTAEHGDVAVPEPQRRTSKTKPNENYAREIMELFCLGPTGPDGTDELHARPTSPGSRRRFTGWRLQRHRAHDEPGLREDHASPRAGSSIAVKTFLGATFQPVTGVRTQHGTTTNPRASGPDRGQPGDRHRARARQPRAVPDPQAVGRVHRQPDPAGHARQRSSAPTAPAATSSSR